MAIYNGSKKDFHKFFGARFRNLVQIMSKKYRRNKGKCEFCESTKNLEAAHVKGFERIKIVNTILSRYKINDSYNVDLIEFENYFIAAHSNMHEVIKVLCKECHLKYDEESKIPVIKGPAKVEKSVNANRLYTNTQIQKIISTIFSEYNEDTIERYLDNEVCKEVFNLRYPLLIRAPKNSNPEFKRNIVHKDGSSRWSWKYSFVKGDFVYAICTQWYEKNDVFFKRWLEEIANS